MILSTDHDLQLEVKMKPTMSARSIEVMIEEAQAQIQELTTQRHHLELSLVTVYLSKILTATVDETVQLGLQFHLGVVFTHCC